MKPPEDHPEWSDYGRDPRIPPAGLVIVLLGLIAFIAAVVGVVAAT